MKKKKQRVSAQFCLRLTKEERKKLNLAAEEKGVSASSLVRFILKDKRII